MARFEISGPRERGRKGIAYALLDGQEVSGLLDYGCGNGAFPIEVAERLGISVHACDVDAERIAALAGGRHGDRVDFFAVPEDPPELALGNGSISAITCCDVLEHMSPELRLATLGELRRVIADDGVLVVTTPHKGPFTLADPENVKYYFPRLHARVFRAVRGREDYERRYGGEGRYGNFSGGATRHEHFSRRELAALLAEAGFEVEEVRYFRLFQPFIRVVLWLSENLDGRLPGAGRLRALCWRAYTWDAGLEPGRLGYDIGLRASPSPRRAAP